MKRNDARRTQRGFFAVGFALALLAGFSVAGWGIVELAEGDARTAAQPAPTATAQAGDDTGASWAT